MQKKNMISIFVCMLLIITSAFTVAGSISLDKPILANSGRSNQSDGNTLITELQGGRVFEIDSGGTVVWEKTGLNWPLDAERLSNGNTLIAEMYNFRVIEVDSGGAIVWEYSGMSGPFDAERLDNGNTLIADTYANRVIEVHDSNPVT